VQASRLYILLLSLGFAVSNNSVNAQLLLEPDTIGLKHFQSAPLNIKEPISNIRMGGFFRTLGYVRHFNEIYPLDIPGYYTGPYPQPTTISVGTGYREPMMLLSIAGKASKTVSVGSDLMLNSPYNGSFDSNSIALYLGTNFYSTVKTEKGKFGVHAGGINWYRQSKLTVWAEEGYLRYSLFERAPYDPLSIGVSDRYGDYYDKGSISQDLRFGNIAFQGMTFTGSQIKGPSKSEVSFQSILGKTQQNTGEIVSYGKDDYCAGLRINDEFQNGANVAFNFFTSYTATDSVKNDFRQFNVQSLEFDFKVKELRLMGEAGIGSYESSNVEKSSGEAVVVNMDIPAKYSLIPLRLQYMRIAPEAVNVNASFQNTSVVDLVQTAVVEDGANPTVLASFGGPVNSLGFLANNREGFSLNTEFNIGNLFVSGGLGFYRELERINANFSYAHNVPGLMLSRIQYFSSGYGPYEQFNSFYRGVFENVTVTDTLYVAEDGSPLFDKFYCSSDLQMKYKTVVAGRNLYVFSLTNFNTAQDYSSILPVADSTAFIRHLNQQIDLSYELNDRIALVGKYGLERVVGNQFTDLDDTDPYPADNTWGVTEDYIPSMKPRDQYGKQLGFGLDLKLNEGAYLYLRHTAYHYYDLNFSATNIKGSESTLELKITF
jgi:hypothetical protein